jgi:hypothetical protein
LLDSSSPSIGGFNLRETLFLNHSALSLPDYCRGLSWRCIQHSQISFLSDVQPSSKCSSIQISVKDNQNPGFLPVNFLSCWAAPLSVYSPSWTVEQRILRGCCGHGQRFDDFSIHRIIRIAFGVRRIIDPVLSFQKGKK